MHGRLFPRKNGFSYNVYNIALPLSQLGAMPLKHNRFGLLSFYDRDHGRRDGSALEDWARGILHDHGLTERCDGDIVLICMPRVLGYVFDPVSFWLCYDKQDRLAAVLCEVHNTFGEDHTYLCRAEPQPNQDKSGIEPQHIMSAEKLFHVSPFLEREGHYRFRFDSSDEKFSVWIDYYDAQSRKKLVTSLIGHYEEMTPKTLQSAFYKYPLVTFKAIFLIHWQAFKLIAKGIKYIHRPAQIQPKISSSDKIKKI